MSAAAVAELPVAAVVLLPVADEDDVPMFAAADFAEAASDALLFPAEAVSVFEAPVAADVFDAAASAAVFAVCAFAPDANTTALVSPVSPVVAVVPAVDAVLDVVSEVTLELAAAAVAPVDALEAAASDAVFSEDDVPGSFFPAPLPFDASA